jgi:excisionase family DNA binding protein
VVVFLIPQSIYMSEIKPNEVYTTQETQELLKVSNSTLKRILKSGFLRANKIGKQYRIMGHEILRLVSPSLEERAVSAYQKVKVKTATKIKNW